MGLAGRENKQEEKSEKKGLRSEKRRRGGCRVLATQSHSQTYNKKERKDIQR